MRISPHPTCRLGRNCLGVALHTITKAQALPHLGFPEGAKACDLHLPRVCTHCGHAIPWYDGSVCDYCDRYMDEDGD